MSPPPPRLLTVAPADPAFAALAAELLAQGYALRFRAAGRSMRPTLHDGDVLTVVPATAAAIRPGHIVLYRLPRAGVVAHRVLGRAGPHASADFLVRGDAAGGAPDPVPPADILGLVTHRERAGHTRRLDTFAARWTGWLWALLRTARHQPARSVP